MSKYRKHEGRVATTNEKKTILNSKAANVMDSNPFENYKQKRKMNVMGVHTQVVHKSKGHSNDLQKRRETLLVEFKKKDRGNKFLDARDKHAEKTFKKVTTKSLKRGRFNIEDDDDVGASNDVLNANLGDLNVHDDFELGEEFRDLDEQEYEQAKKVCKFENYNSDFLRNGAQQSHHVTLIPMKKEWRIHNGRKRKEITFVGITKTQQKRYVQLNEMKKRQRSI
jgi:hypothetical protein